MQEKLILDKAGHAGVKKSCPKQVFKKVGSLKLNNIRKSKDFYAGLIFIFFGLFAVMEARHYPLGTAASMGPGYFPLFLGGILILFGLVISGRSLRSSGGTLKSFALRPMLLVTLAVLAFALLLEPAGVALATLALITISSLGGWEVRLREVVLIYLGLAALAVGLFVYGLGLPFKVWP